MTDKQSLVIELIAACEAYHQALDSMFAMMIAETRNHTLSPFMPSECGQPWTALVNGNALIERAKRELALDELVKLSEDAGLYGK